MPLIHLVNPNTSQATTEMMLALARSHAPVGLAIEPKTARHGAPLIVDAEALAVAETAVIDLAPEFDGDGVMGDERNAACVPAKDQCLLFGQILIARRE